MAYSMKRRLPRPARIAFFAALALAIAAAALRLHPPELFRVGAQYGAKIVCSNVFLAGRDEQDVFAHDVQAPGNPLLRLMRVRVDRARGTVRTGAVGFRDIGLAVHRPGTGCAVVPDFDEARAAVASFEPRPLPPPPAGEPWPAGSQAQPDARLASVVADDRLAGPGLRALLVVRDGHLVAERYGSGFDRATPLLGWSMTKTVTAALVGIAVADGRLRLDQAGFWPPAGPGDERSRITIADLLAMGSGLRFDEEYGTVSDVTRMLYLEPDAAAFAASQPLLHPPGTYWSYSTGGPVLLSRILQQAVGPGALAYPRERLFAPLGMSSAVLEADARGTLVGGSYLYADAQDWARFAQFLLQDGAWNGTRILPPDWVAMMRQPFPPSAGQYGRGAVWLQWSEGASAQEAAAQQQRLPPDTYWLRGHDGQFIAIVPSARVIVLRMGLTPARLHYRPQVLLDAVLQALR